MPDIRTIRALPLTLALIATPAIAADPPDEVVRRGLERYLDAAAAQGFTGAVLVAHGPAPLRIALEVEPEPPHRIAGIAVQVGD